MQPIRLWNRFVVYGRTAEFQEREVYEMFGVNFSESPRSEVADFAGWMGRKRIRLRKDFDDPINMIRL
jgi:NADH:ubiquinone oxidoreductase subunit C